MSLINLNPTPASYLPEWISTPQVMERISVKRTKLNSLMRFDPTFPKPVRLSHNCLRWKVSELESWIKAQEQKRGENNV